MKWKNYSQLIVLFLSATLYTCQKKDIDIGIVQEGCKNMRIVNAKYETIADPSCGGTSDSAEYKITFTYDEKNRDCLKKIFIDPVFYTRNKGIINPLSYTSLLNDTDKSVSINSGTASFTFKCKFASLKDADTLNNIFFKIHTENSLGEKSKDLQLRINAKCSGVNASLVPLAAKDTISTLSNTIQLKLWDDGKEDGDIVSVAVNDNWVFQNYTLTNAGKKFTITVPNNNFRLVVVAMNQGTVGPNTCALSINDGKTIELNLDLVTGQAVDVYRK